ncbi:hypothetical protein HMPREF1119_1282 [Haemophilus parainfluenzae HK2019]|uniref:Uncharacterized protein n=1 Tax=Haemophilus parainfluenzae HK2019 TaxID=1095746 RepID=A0ABP2NXH0_HAEPA|nr:hypothetical protein HMPREF1119_1282 [Haemophilus parainfluenzae HK2019]
MSCSAQHRAARPSENQRASGVGQNHLAAAVGGFSPPLSANQHRTLAHRRLRRPDFRRLRPRPAQRQPAPMRQPDCPHRRQPANAHLRCPRLPRSTRHAANTRRFGAPPMPAFPTRRPRQPLAFSAKRQRNHLSGLRTFQYRQRRSPAGTRAVRIRHRPAAALSGAGRPRCKQPEKRFIRFPTQTRARDGGVPQPQTALAQSAGVGGYDGGSVGEGRLRCRRPFQKSCLKNKKGRLKT